MSRLSYLAVLTVLCLALAGTAYAATTNVSSGQSIQAAITAAAAGDTIIVGPGIYAENIVISKPITLVGNVGAVIRVSSGTGIRVKSANVSVVGFIIDGSQTANWGFLVAGTGVTNILIEDNYIYGFTTAIYLDDGISHLTITGNVIGRGAGNGGVTVVKYDYINIFKNTFYNTYVVPFSATMIGTAFNYNNFIGNAGVLNYASTGTVDARFNWWSSSIPKTSGGVNVTPVRTVAIPMRRVLGDKELPGATTSVSNDSFIGTGAWKATPGPKVEKAFAPEFLFGHAIKVSDIKNISFATKNAAGSNVNDWYTTIYTKPYVGGKGTWYGQRLTGEPMYSRNLDAPAGQWNVWSSDAAAAENQLVFHDSNWSASGYSSAPTLGEIVETGDFNWAGYPQGQTTSINYGVQEVLYVYFSTGNPGCLTFDGMIDAFKIELWSGESITLDLESDGASDALWVDVDPATQYVKPGDSVFAYLNMSNTSQLVNGYQAFLGYDTSFLGVPTITPASVPFAQFWPLNSAVGEVDLAAGTDVFNGELATNQAANLASLAFTASSAGTTNIFFRPDTELKVTTFSTDQDGLATARINSPNIVIDDVNPTIAAPADIAGVPNDTGRNYATGIKLGYPEVADDLSGVASVTNNAPAQFPVGTTTVTWTVTDKSGNQSTDTQTVEVVDVDAPTITAPADVTVNTDPGVCYAAKANVALGTPTTADNCGVVSVTNDAPAQFAKGITVVTWTAKDAAGNSTTATQKVTVEDNEAPVIGEMTSIVKSNTAGQCGTMVMLPAPQVTDNCDSIVSLQWQISTAEYGTFMTLSASPGASISTSLEVGIYTAKLVATDDSGNVAEQTITITVNDDEIPVVTAPADITMNADPGTCAAVIRPVSDGKWSFKGSASYVNDAERGPVLQATSIAGMPNSSVTFMLNTPVAFADISELSVDYKQLVGRFAWGSPRFVLGLDTNGDDKTDNNVVIYMGAMPNATDTDLNIWKSTGNLIMAADNRFDLTHVGGAYYGTRQDALTKLAGMKVTGVWISVDGSGATNQEILFDNIKVGSNVFDPGNPGVATAADNCGIQSIVGTRSDNEALDAPYPVGVTTITWVATDIHGNVSVADLQTVTVNNLYDASVSVELEGVAASLSRTITFQVGDGTKTYTQNVPVTFVNGKGTASFTIPACSAWTCVTAKDAQHTLRGQLQLKINGSQYSASFTGAEKLLGGDLTNDNIVDIRDFGVFAGQFNTSPALTTTWSTRNADINCDGIVGTGDFAYLQLPARFLSKGEDLCGGTAIQAKPMSSMSVYALVLYSGLANATAADVNNDKIVDQTDVQLFVQKYMAPKRGR